MRRAAALLVAALAAACGLPTVTAPPAPAALAAAESLYLATRDTRDRIDVLDASGADTTMESVARGPLVQRYDSLRRALALRLDATHSASLRPADARALGVMRRALDRDLGATPAPVTGGTAGAPDCGDKAFAGAGSADSLRARIYACYGWAQSHLTLDGGTVDRLTILSALGHTGDPARRRQLFLSLEPVWRSMNGGNEPASRYRRLIALEADRSDRHELPSVGQARATGVEPDSLERWLVRILETWRDVTPSPPVEPWDWYYETGRASRVLSPRVPLERLSRLNDSVYDALGADLATLRVHYDLAPREGKTPVAFTTFGGRDPIVPWVFATYRTGGLDNLNELLHETGHAIHLAAIRTRPALTDWPDSDPFTEAVADFIALEVYEPAWQQRWLGDSVPLADGLRARYGAIMLDVAWALFEVRLLRDPASDPDSVWTNLTGEYLHIRPHPEMSWWAMRGQLVDQPGYMMNYAAGAIVIAAIRERTRTRHGAFSTGDPGWYAWVAPRLYRFGLERPTREVLEEFLGGPVTPAALLRDLRRMRPATGAGCGDAC
jgi:hypothetical protein